MRNASRTNCFLLYAKCTSITQVAIYIPAERKTKASASVSIIEKKIFGYDKSKINTESISNNPIVPKIADIFLIFLIFKSNLLLLSSFIYLSLT